MLISSQKLNPKIFDKDVEMQPIRKGFGEGLLAAGEADERVVGLCADLTESTQMHLFKEKFPHRFVEIGVAEQNLATVASGMAAMGKIPFISSYAMFSPGRNWEQIRTTIAYNNVPVKIAGSHAGVSVGPDGGSHQALEDIAMMRVMPRMVVLSPCDSIEARKATIAAAKTNTPVYIRLARDKTPVITTEETPFEIGKASLLWEPHNLQGPTLYTRSDLVGRVGIIVTGSLVHEALKAARQLEEIERVSVSVLNLATIKPLDVDAVVKLTKEAGAIVTVEEHQKMGGMGSAVAECLAGNCPVPIEFVAVDDQFGQSGTPSELVAHYGLDAPHIVQAVRKVISRK
ncbi:MAG: transketolase [Candidatus Taylorbacteria bacterium RIFCSPLOWO2_02_FULL_43_11]|uniref:Transketolase n=1 Tax=Candidatus Taylorbacteria bacterium RIFCSPHIGHO2_02_FULL_46_13 TaxID=1802312 RepID=A0A1G2MU05_9BACT|nr:MAG: transketolase [Candidatus Taylorbacteria bacterium RIFCSPHIGHO2_02_FULL_46_13]OHA36764.1 MAG: transketolase [Candidatus Taylorbacteria bacterium RIFCSPLOWO2_02_FULL_43_11]